MRKLVLGALFIGATGLASGCIFVSDDDDDDVFPGSLELAWQLQDATGADICPVGGDTAELVAIDNLTDETFTDLVNCTDGVNTIDDLLPGDYTVRVNIVSDDRSIVFASSEDATATVFDDTITEVPTFTILTEEGFFGFTWTLTDGGGPLLCDEVPSLDGNGDALACTVGGGECDGLSATAFCGDDLICRDVSTGVDIAATVLGGSDLNATIFNCEDGEGVTQPFPLDDYTISFSVLVDDGTGTDDVATLVSQPIEDSLDIGNVIVDLGDVLFDF